MSRELLEGIALHIENNVELGEAVGSALGALDQIIKNQVIVLDVLLTPAFFNAFPHVPTSVWDNSN